MTRFELIEQELASLKNTVQIDTAAPQWGEIEGTLSAQVDLNAAIVAAKARANHTGIQSADTVVDGTNNKAFTATEKTKLAAINTVALADRANHTGTQSADTIIDGTTNKVYTATEKTKLGGIATGATVNSPDATLLARANHTGTQAISSVSGLQTALDGKANVSHIHTPADIPAGVQIVVLPSNVPSVSTSYADLTGLSFTVIAGGVYWFRFFITYTAAATTTGARFSIFGPLTGTVLRYQSEWNQDVADPQIYNRAQTGYDNPSTAGISSVASGKGNIAIIEGTVIPGESGSMVARFASEVSGSTINALGGVSFVEYRKLN